MPAPFLGLIRAAGIFSKTAKTFPAVHRYARSVVHDGIFEGRHRDHDHTIAVFERWQSEVIATVPADRLLVFEVTEGWEPLCSFLDVPVPDQPFPRTNAGASFDKNLARRLLGRKPR